MRRVLSVSERRHPATPAINDALTRARQRRPELRPALEALEPYEKYRHWLTVVHHLTSVGKRRTAKVTFRWLNAQLKTVEDLKDRRFEIVRVQPAQSVPSDTPGTPDTPVERLVVTVTVELNDWRECIQLTLCVMGYYLAVVLAWWAWCGFHGQATPASDLGWLGFGLSILMLPAMLIALAAKLAVYQALGVTRRAHAGLTWNCLAIQAVCFPRS